MEWQATALAVGGLVVGVPVGVLAGVAVWRAIADSLGVRATASLPVELLLVAPVAILAVTLIARCRAAWSAGTTQRLAARRVGSDRRLRVVLDVRGGPRGPGPRRPAGRPGAGPCRCRPTRRRGDRRRRCRRTGRPGGPRCSGRARAAGRASPSAWSPAGPSSRPGRRVHQRAGADARQQRGVRPARPDPVEVVSSTSCGRVPFPPGWISTSSGGASAQECSACSTSPLAHRTGPPSAAIVVPDQPSSGHCWVHGGEHLPRPDRVQLLHVLEQHDADRLGSLAVVMVRMPTDSADDDQGGGRGTGGQGRRRQGRARTAPRRALLPHGRGVRAPRARAGVGRRHARRTGRLAASSSRATDRSWTSGCRGVARRRRGVPGRTGASCRRDRRPMRGGAAHTTRSSFAGTTCPTRCRNGPAWPT